MAVVVNYDRHRSTPLAARTIYAAADIKIAIMRLKTHWDVLNVCAVGVLIVGNCEDDGVRISRAIQVRGSIHKPNASLYHH